MYECISQTRRVAQTRSQSRSVKFIDSSHLEFLCESASLVVHPMGYFFLSSLIRAHTYRKGRKSESQTRRVAAGRHHGPRYFAHVGSRRKPRARSPQWTTPTPRPTVANVAAPGGTSSSGFSKILLRIPDNSKSVGICNKYGGITQPSHGLRIALWLASTVLPASSADRGIGG